MRSCSAVIVFCCALYGIATAQQAIADDTDFSAAQLTTPPTDGWITNGGTLFNQRWSPLKQINRGNVAGLKGVWRLHLDSGMKPRNSAEGQPLVYKGVIYHVTGENDVFAIDVKTGKVIWKYYSGYADDLNLPVCCGWVSRGLGLGRGKLFLGRLDGKLMALDMKTGAVVWEVQAMLPQHGYSITSAPLYYDGLVITGFAGGERGVRGLVQAYAADSGEHVWTFNTIPGPGEFGHDTWPQDNHTWRHGGATMWQTPAVDPELGLIYFSTGNAGPDFNGAIRAGDNLFSASILALEARTGKYRWHFQEVHHDLWDYDAANPVILFDLNLNGVPRKGLAQAGKTGWVYILDRVTGAPLIGIEERPVLQEPRQATAATQPYPVGDSFVPQFVDIAPEGVTLVNQGRIFTPYGPGTPGVVAPSPAGSANWPPSSYDPTRQIMYVCAAENSTVIEGGGDPTMELTAELTGAPLIGGTWVPPGRIQTGTVSALDMTTNKLVWQYRWQDHCYSGFVSTAGDLLFVGRNDGRLTALDSDTGLQLWEFQTGAGMNSTVTVFEQDGAQYVLAYSGGNIFARSDKGDSLWLFALHGTLEPTTPGDTMAAAAGIKVVFADGAPDLDSGGRLYTQTCLPCHGEDGAGSHGGAPLNKLTDIKQTITTVTTGRNTMPSFARALTSEQIRDVSGYILERLVQ